MARSRSYTSDSPPIRVNVSSSWSKSLPPVIKKNRSEHEYERFRCRTVAAVCSFLTKCTIVDSENCNVDFNVAGDFVR